MYCTLQFYHVDPKFKLREFFQEGKLRRNYILRKMQDYKNLYSVLVFETEISQFHVAEFMFHSIRELKL